MEKGGRGVGHSNDCCSRGSHLIKVLIHDHLDLNFKEYIHGCSEAIYISDLNLKVGNELLAFSGETILLVHE